MKQTFYILKNESGSEGTFLINGEYKSIYPGEKFEFTQKPTNKTENVTLIMYRKEVGESPILNKIKR